MNILAIDFGTKLFGFAISLLNIPIPYESIKYENDNQIINEIKKIINDEKINLIILGIPLNKKSKDTERSILVKKFYENLKEKIDLEIILINEQNSTKESIDSLKNFGYNKKQISKIKDSVSAMNILKRYLNI